MLETEYVLRKGRRIGLLTIAVLGPSGSAWVHRSRRPRRAHIVPCTLFAITRCFAGQSDARKQRYMPKSKRRQLPVEAAEQIFAATVSGTTYLWTSTDSTTNVRAALRFGRIYSDGCRRSIPRMTGSCCPPNRDRPSWSAPFWMEQRRSV